jgi:hypothetical protein
MWLSFDTMLLSSVLSSFLLNELYHLICTWISKFMEVWSGGTEENRALPSFEE